RGQSSRASRGCPSPCVTASLYSRRKPRWQSSRFTTRPNTAKTSARRSRIASAEASPLPEKVRVGRRSFRSSTPPGEGKDRGRHESEGLLRFRDRESLRRQLRSRAQGDLGVIPQVVVHSTPPGSGPLPWEVRSGHASPSHLLAVAGRSVAEV